MPNVVVAVVVGVAVVVVEAEMFESGKTSNLFLNLSIRNSIGSSWSPIPNSSAILEIANSSSSKGDDGGESVHYKYNKKCSNNVMMCESTLIMTINDVYHIYI